MAIRRNETPHSRIGLTLVQQETLFAKIGRSSDALDVRQDGERVVATLSKRECSACLLATGMQGVRLLGDGRCNFCHLYGKMMQETISGLPFTVVDNRVRSVKMGQCVVAFSGGKDSARVLAFARKHLQIKTVAVFFDNGFIPQEVRRNGKALAERLGAEWLEVREDLSKPFRTYFQTGNGPLPCQACAARCFRAIGDVSRARQCPHVLTGHWGPLLHRPLADFTAVKSDEQVTLLSPLPALAGFRKSLQTILARAGWRPAALPGNTTNCEIPPLFERSYYHRYGYHPAVADLSEQIRAGWIAKEEARRRLRIPRLDQPGVADLASKLALPANSLA